MTCGIGFLQEDSRTETFPTLAPGGQGKTLQIIYFLFQYTLHIVFLWENTSDFFSTAVLEYLGK